MNRANKIALAESAESWFKENRMSTEKKVFIHLPTPTTTQMRSVVHGNDRYYKRRFTGSPLFWTLLVGAAVLMGYALVQIVRAQ